MSAELRGLTDATPTGGPQHTTSLDLAGGPGIGRPGLLTSKTGSTAPAVSDRRGVLDASEISTSGLDRPGREEIDPRIAAGSAAPGFEGQAGYTPPNWTETAPDMRRPDQRHRHAPRVGPTASWIPQRQSAPTRPPEEQTQTPGMDRPGQLVRADEAGSIAPGLEGRLGPTPPMEAQTAPDARRPGGASPVEATAGSTTRGATASDPQDTNTPQPLSQLVEAGRRKIASAMDSSERGAKKLIESNRNGDS